MFHKLQVDQYQKAGKILSSLDIHLAIKSIIEGKSTGRIYVDDLNHPNSAFIWGRNRTFLVGNSENEGFNTEVKNLFEKQIYPESLKSSIDGFSLCYSPDSWGNTINNVILNGTNPIEDHRQYFRFKELKHNWRELIPDGYSLHPVNSNVLENKTLENLDALIEEMQSERPSVAAFLEKSFGYCVIHEGKLVAWCLSEYNSKNRCEVGIETQMSYQRIGLAIVTSSALIEHAVEQGITNIGWHCFDRNKASIATAKSVGFEKVCEYPSFWGIFDRAINLAVNGNWNFERKEYRQATEWYLAAIETEEVPAWVYWNTACACAHLDQKEAVYKYLDQAIALGFTDLEFIQNSEHFKKWHGTQEWNALLNKLRAGDKRGNTKLRH